jgi:hypothetical protein
VSITHTTAAKFTSRIIKASALITDSKILLANWQAGLSTPENIAALYQSNPFGKSSHSRLEDMLPILRRRYMADPVVASGLATISRSSSPGVLKQLLYFYSVRADPLLFAFVTEELLDRYRRGRQDVPTDEVIRLLREWVDVGRTTTRWSSETISRVAQGILATLRDFDILTGAVHKRLNPPPLSLTAFAFLAFDLSRTRPSGAQLLGDPKWQVFFLEPNMTERLFIAADQAGLLRFAAAGTVVRVDFPVKSLEDYSEFLTHANNQPIA